MFTRFWKSPLKPVIPDDGEGDDRVPVTFVLFFWHLMEEYPGYTVRHMNINVYFTEMSISVELFKAGEPFALLREEYRVSLDGMHIHKVMPV